MEESNKDTQGKKTLLVVEDDLFVRDLYVRTLERADFNVITAVDGQEGLTHAQEDHPDIILLDIMLPKINGIEVLKTLKAKDNTKNIPVFLLTNLGQEAIIKEAFSIGASGYFLKARLLPQEVAEHVKEFLSTGQVPEASKMV
ncbi:response regulator [candidate division WWE3 bacterium]|uniref:Response regulator n=1 Tax=candidate division WWE3 bacterium TaxID=2053526 RepID=A0A955RRR8_UNCKA|nr:response regulator [candidate division WWE3 bacterium]